MLRIGPSGPPQAQPPSPPDGGGGEMPSELQAALAAMSQGQPDAPPDDGGGQTRYDAQKISLQTSGYMGPEAGPFECQHCTHFEGPNACAIVQGKIDPAGCCNLFEPSDDQGPDDQTDPNQDPTAGPPPAGGPPLPPGPPQ